MEGEVKSNISPVGLTLQPHRCTLKENFLKNYHIFKKFRSRSFIWVVKHFCRNTKSWFFSPLNMVIFCQIANFHILLNISGLKDQAQNWLFFQIAQKPTCSFSTKMFDHSNERSWSEILENMKFFWKFSFKVHLWGSKFRPTGEMPDFTFPSICSRSLWTNKHKTTNSFSKMYSAQNEWV